MPEEHCDLLCLDLERAEELRESAPAASELERVALELKALADPTRLQLASALTGGEELCVCDLSWIVERADKLVSHHLRLMRTAGILRSRKDGKMVLYSLTERGERVLEGAMISEAPV